MYSKPCEVQFLHRRYESGAFGVGAQEMLELLAEGAHDFWATDSEGNVAVYVWCRVVDKTRTACC